MISVPKGFAFSTLLLTIFLFLSVSAIGGGDFSPHAKLGRGVPLNPEVAAALPTITEESVDTPCDSMPGTPKWYEKHFCGGNLTIQVPFESVGFSAWHNSVRCADGFRLSIDQTVRVLDSMQVVHSDVDGTETKYIKTSTGEYLPENTYLNTTVITSTSETFTVNKRVGDRLLFQPKAGSADTFILASLTDKNGNVTAYNRSNASQTVITEPYGRQIRINRGAGGHPTRITGLRGEIWELTYDDSNRLVQVRDPLTRLTLVGYGIDGNAFELDTAPPQSCVVTGFSAPGALTFSYSYYLGGVLRQIKGFGTADYTYTPSSVRIRGPGTDLIQRYDSQGRITSENDGAVGHSYVWDGKNLRESRGAHGMTTTYTYLGNRLETETAPSGMVTRYEYDPLGNLITLTKGSAVTRYEWLAIGYQRLMTRMVMPNATEANMEYDTAGNLKVTRKGDGVVAAFIYDARGKVKRKTDFTGSTLYDYDSFGNLIRTTAPNGAAETYTANNNGTPLTKVTADGLETVYDQLDGSGAPGRERTFALRTNRTLVGTTTRSRIYDAGKNEITETETFRPGPAAAGVGRGPQ